MSSLDFHRLQGSRSPERRAGSQSKYKGKFSTGTEKVGMLNSHEIGVQKGTPGLEAREDQDVGPGERAHSSMGTEVLEKMPTGGAYIWAVTRDDEDTGHARFKLATGFHRQ